MVDFNGSDPEV